MQPQEEIASTFTADEVAGFIAESRREGLIDEDEHELLTGALAFNEVQVGSVVLGMQDLVMVREDVTLNQLHDGRVLGVATLEDVLEELVGDVVDAGQKTG